MIRGRDGEGRRNLGAFSDMMEGILELANSND